MNQMSGIENQFFAKQRRNLCKICAEFFFAISLFIFISLPLFSFAAIIGPGETYNGYRCAFSSYGCDTENVYVQPTNSGVNIYGWESVGGQSSGASGVSCTVPPRDFSALICIITNNILSPLIPILTTLALIAFFWGVAKYVIQGAHDEKSREQGKQIMLWGIIGLFVMVSVWGLVTVVKDTFNLGNAPFRANQVRISR
ncbi:MAG: hypothetical protein HZC03_02025 [Candidatus Lloydbacteria bacterium]|nr:hypothetical protein [Candidatus Lloydbacteria bacterium]